MTRGVDPTALERGRMDHVSRGYYPAGDFTPLDGLVYVTLQELATRISHRNTGTVTNDPVAEKLMARIAVDENLHYVFYRDVSAGALELDPSSMMCAIQRQVLGFAMPGCEGWPVRVPLFPNAASYHLEELHATVTSLPPLKKGGARMKVAMQIAGILKSSRVQPPTRLPEGAALESIRDAVSKAGLLQRKAA